MNRATKAIIYKENLVHNISQIKNLVEKNTKICIAVKADSYGHNAILTSKIAEEIGIEYLAVATIGEAFELREAGIKSKILLLSLCTPEEFEDIFKLDLIPLVFTKEYIQGLSDAADKFYKNDLKKVAVHLAVDTGMGRIGCYANEAGEQAKLINSKNHLELQGMCTHFAVSDSLTEENQKFTKNQYDNFVLAVENVKKEGINPGICHCGSSAALLNNKEMHFDMVRPGIITYGYYPDEITQEYMHSKGLNIDLKPVLAFETKVVAIRHFEKGKTISYGRTYACPEDTDIAVLPIGYADGLLRRFSPEGKVTINGKLYPICGRICMDQCMVNIGKNNPDVKLWDKVVIFGPSQSGALMTADDYAKNGNTISYEVLTSISKRVERVVEG